MWIKSVKKKDRKGNLTYTYYRLMQSVRTVAGVKQRTLLNLGKLEIPKEKHKDLANRIEEITMGLKHVFAPIDKEIEPLANHYAKIIIEKKLILKKVTDIKEETPKDKKTKDETLYQTVNMSSLKNTNSRTIGGEHIVLSAIKKLKLDKCLQQLGFNQTQINLSIAMITGRLLSPGSEKATREWLQNLSGIGDLLQTDFRNLSNNAPYRITDQLLQHKTAIEKHLKQQEEQLFSLESKIILYDLTNTYLEGKGKNITKASYGRSKEKRSDCLLITLGLIIDEHGFPKASKIMEGNVSEPKTLMTMIKDLETLGSNKLSNSKKTILMDAGIATKDNLEKLKENGYDYVCVARGKPVELSEIDKKGIVVVKEDKSNIVKTQMIKREDEAILYCQSTLKREKEQAMKTKYQQRFEEELKKIESSLHNTRGVKEYDKTLKRIGRLTEKYSKIARFYKIIVTKEEKTSKATSIKWKLIKQKLMEESFSGGYFIKTSRTDLTEQDIWSLYVTLTQVEDAFRTIKTDLNARPIYHKKGKRVDAHLFIVILSYHILNTIRYQLKLNKINLSWSGIRKMMSSHTVVTTSFNTKEGKGIHIRNCIQAELFHKTIYNALSISQIPLKPVKTIF